MIVENMPSDTQSDVSWTELSKEIDEFTWSEHSESDSDDTTTESEPEETPVYGATLEQLDKLWGDGRWKVTAMHLADYIAQKDYLPIQYCCGQIHD